MEKMMEINANLLKGRLWNWREHYLDRLFLKYCTEFPSDQCPKDTVFSGHRKISPALVEELLYYLMEIDRLTAAKMMFKKTCSRNTVELSITLKILN